ncbi:hypothetical protein CMK12_05320 [Candidatus Poribacteria bacterium]|jgi:hypothetical protein|nr:hypothetical protein [Candidatus Poribacteria bacterium]MDP6598900.1 hypothetical protein [Candidatus Poribacteria bacterium]MDP6746059.1 hypothetical protein [Candidatus Poribacteria bacterium]MDP6996262.1 hypothetical protein [Candidatus Poribacteria bacterium]
MRKQMLIFGLVVWVCGLTQAKDVEIALEAELAQKIEAPMKADDNAVGKGASNGEFIWMEGKPVAGGGGKGWAEFVVPIKEKGKYAIWGRVIAWDGNSDSFWVTWQPADPNEDAQATKNTKFRWAVAGGAVWHWDRINAWLDGGKPEREWEFKQPGETTLRISVREDATMLDTLFITSNVKAKDPGAANVRLPTKKDREIQVKGQAVDPADKVAITWATLKRR